MLSDKLLGAQDVCLFHAAAALVLAEKAKSRLLTEAEWEYVARAGGVRAWLSGNEDAESYAVSVLADKLSADGHPFGVHGLGWGSWVEDGWQLSYRDAPSDGSAWKPRQIPQVARGGALLSYPWQVDGEALLLHAAHRERLFDRNFPVMLARDLPAR